MHIPSPSRVCPGRSPQVSNPSAPSGWPGTGTTLYSSPLALDTNREAPGAGRDQQREAPPRGRSGAGRWGGRRGWGRGWRAGAGVSLPPSFSPVKSRGAAGLSPVSSSCSLGRAAVTVHRRRRGLHRRVRPPASMATTATCTRFTDDYQLFEELGKYGRPPPVATPNPAPAARALCGSLPRPPALHWSLQRPLGPPHPQPFPPAASGAHSPLVLCPAAPSAPCISCPYCCTPRCCGDCSPRTAPGRSPAPPLAHPSGASHLDPASSPPPPHSAQESLSTPSHVPHAWHSRPSPALQLQPCCGARVWGDVWCPAPPPASASSRISAGLLGCTAAPPQSPPPIPAVVPGAARRSRSIPLPSALSWPLLQPQHPHPTRGAEPGHCSPRPTRPLRCFQSWRVRTPILGWGKHRGKYGERELWISETHNWILSFPAIS